MSVDVQFAALADFTRCRVIELLHEKPRPVHDLAAAFAISRPAISRHLRVLKEAGLVKEEKRGRENVYSLQRQRLQTPSDWLGIHLGAKPVPARAATSKAKAGVRLGRTVPADAPVAPQMELDF